MSGGSLDERAQALIDEVCRVSGAIGYTPSVTELTAMLDKHGLRLYAEPVPVVVPYIPTLAMLDAGRDAQKVEGNTLLHVWWAMYDAATKGQA